MERDPAVHRLEMKRGAALTDVGVDLMTDLPLNGDRVANRDPTVHRFCDQVCGILIGPLHGNAAISRLGHQAGSVPLIPVQLYIQSTVHGRGVHVAAQVIEGKTTVRRIYMDHAYNVSYFDTAVHRVQLRGNMARHAQTPIDRPTAVREAPVRGSVGVDRARGDDLYFACQRLRILEARILRNHLRLQGDILALLANHVDAAILARNTQLPIDHRQGCAPQLANTLLVARGPVVVGVAFIARARRGGKGLRRNAACEEKGE